MTAMSCQWKPATNTSTTHIKYRADIDGLRAVAVISVLVFHAFPSLLKGGFIGVDIFFVISGFLITSILRRELLDATFSIRGFYARRIKRIFPALIIVLSAAYAFGWATLTPEEYQQLGFYIGAGAGFIANIALWANAGYFDSDSISKPLLHLWSLGIEEQFYLIWPVLLLAAYRLRSSLMGLTLALVSVSFIANILFIKETPTTVFYWPFTRFWELLAGAIIAFTSTEERLNLSLPQKNLISTIGAFGILLGLVIISKANYFPGWPATIPVLSTCLLISAGPEAWVNKRILSNKVFVWIGLISFPLYLWHWPLLSYAQIIFEKTPPHHIRAIILCTSIIFAWLTFALIEKPIRRHNTSKAVVPLLSFAILVIGGIGLLTQASGGLPIQRESIVKNQIPRDLLVWPYATNALCQEKYPYETKDIGFWFCSLSKNEPPRILLLGNSYANDLYPGVTRNTKTKEITTLSIGACLPAMGVDMSDNLALMKNHPCTGKNKQQEEELINSILDNETIQLALINAHWPDFNDKGEWISRDNKVVGHFTQLSPKQVDPKSSLDIFADGLEERIKFLIDRNVAPVIFLGKPESGYDIRTCYARPLLSKATNTCIIDRESEYNRQRPLRERILEIGKKYPKLVVFDKFDVFCNEAKCELISNNKPLIRDSGHLTSYGSELLINQFVEWSEVHAPDIWRRIDNVSPHHGH
jgi:peptidoglycan/LPS O-acetylase OafA/YrhL